MKQTNHPESLSPIGGQLLSRRDFLANTRMSLGAIALTQLLTEQQLLAEEEPIRPNIDPANPHASRSPHAAAKAKRVLVIAEGNPNPTVAEFKFSPIPEPGTVVEGFIQAYDTDSRQPVGERAQWRFVAPN